MRREKREWSDSRPGSGNKTSVPPKGWSRVGFIGSGRQGRSLGESLGRAEWLFGNPGNEFRGTTRLTVSRFGEHRFFDQSPVPLNSSVPPEEGWSGIGAD
jgi:hypothetical protein